MSFFPKLRLASSSDQGFCNQEDQERAAIAVMAEHKLNRAEYSRELSAQKRAVLVRHHSAKRRVATLKRTPPWANQAAIKAVYAEALRLKRETGIEHHVDHIIPLQGELVSGLHVESNLQVLPWRENVMKRNHFEVDA